MADTKITALTALAEAPAPTDLLVLVDVSDTTMGASGTNKKIAYQYVAPQDGWFPAGETWTYASADDPTFTFTVAGVDLTTKYSAGMRIKLTQTTTKYFLVTKVAFSTDTTITIYGGTDYDLANAAITAPFFSTHKAPYGFPLDPTKWTVEATDTTQRSQSTPVSGTWYNLGSVSISIPIGVWNTWFRVYVQAIDASALSWEVEAALSTSNSSESDADLSSDFTHTSTNGVSAITAQKTIALTSKTTHYIITRATVSTLDTLRNLNDANKLIVRAVCAYL